MQKESFQQELEYLLDPAGKSEPNLIKMLNLFLDSFYIIQSKGWIGGSEHPYKVQNPILSGKNTT